MRLRRPFARLRSERGSIMIFTLIVLLFLFMIGGLAVDYAHLFVVDNELTRSMDAAALAAAGMLSFDDASFPTVRTFARDFAEKNGSRAGTVALQPGDVVLGVWDPDKTQPFATSSDGTVVNAVRTRYATEISTSMFRIVGINTIPVSAAAIAIRNPPTAVPDLPVFPLGVHSDLFEGETSRGCDKEIDLAEGHATWVALACPATVPGPPLRIGDVLDEGPECLAEPALVLVPIIDRASRRIESWTQLDITATEPTLQGTITCGILPGQSHPTPVPRGSLAQHPRLVR